jgi:drug/metabolite transporter (DMT)-like permease
MTSQHSLRTELSLLALLALLWGSSYLFLKVAVTEIPPVTLIALRVTGAVGFLLVVMRIRSETLPRDWHTRRMLLQ